jgi:excisionase family DNA binding protein
MTGLGKTTIYRLISEGRIESVAIGRRRLINVKSLLALAGSRSPSRD